MCRCKTPEYERADSWQLTMQPVQSSLAAITYTAASHLFSWHLKVKALMCHLLKAAAGAHAQPWSILFSAYASTLVAVRGQVAQV